LGDILSRAAAPAIPMFLIVIVVFAAIVVGVYPLYPRIMGTFRTQTIEPRFTLLDTKLERLTIAQAASISKGTVFLYQISTTSQGVFDISIIVSYSGQLVAQVDQSGVPMGLYSFSVVLGPRPEQQGIYYHVTIVTNLPNVPTIEADVPPG